MPDNDLNRTFVECVLAGDALDTDIDDFIDRWHTSANDRQSLATYLGFSESEYALWVEQPETLRIILHAKRHDLDLDTIVDWEEAHALAARSMSEAESGILIQWLKNKGYLN